MLHNTCQELWKLHFYINPVSKIGFWWLKNNNNMSDKIIRNLTTITLTFVLGMWMV